MSVDAAEPVSSRRRVPRTDHVMADPRLVEAVGRLGSATVKAAVHEAQDHARRGIIDPGKVADFAVTKLPVRPSSLRPVLNATGVVLHTNLGRAPLGPAAIEALVAASGYTDVEFDVRTGARAGRGRATIEALLRTVPAAEAALVVNNGAAALLLATTALAAGCEVVVSRGEMIEIGDGFRLAELIASTGARVREVGATNRTNLSDYATAMGPATGCILKVHPSNFKIDGFTSSVPVADLVALGAPVIADIGSGLLAPNPLLPDEPDVTRTLGAGAALVTCSGDKLLGGPQAGLILGDAATVGELRRHPLARALRVDKTTLAALEATLAGPDSPIALYLNARPERLLERAERLAQAVGGEVVPSMGAVGGGSAPGTELAGWAVALPARIAPLLRRGDPCVVARVHHGRCMVDLRCVPEASDAALLGAVLAVVE